LLILNHPAKGYVLRGQAQHWTDLDKPSVPDQPDLDEYNKVIGTYVESLTTRYWMK